MAIIAIIGAGMMGTALSWPASDRGHAVRLVGTPLDEEAIRSVARSRVHPGLQREVPRGVDPYPVDELERAIDGADVVVNGVSSFGIAWFTKVVGPLLRPDVPVLSVTKGLEADPDGSLVTLPEAIDRALPPSLRGRISISAIGGPCTAHELAARRQTWVVFTGAHPGTLARLRDLLATDYYHVSMSTDVVGVEVCAALKNAYALGVGLAVGQMEAVGPDGLALAYNPQAALFGQACHELRMMLALVGGDPAHVSGLPGAGDLFVTVFGGRTVRLGRMLGQGMPFAEARSILEGVTLESVQVTTVVARALPMLERRGSARCSDFPLLMHLDRIVNHGEVVNIPWDAFFEGTEPER